jgi:hypothetical protein
MNSFAHGERFPFFAKRNCWIIGITEDHFHSIIKGSPRANELHENENFLLIFSYCDPLAWRGLVYKNDWWKEIATP